jgi:hypothetical protein
VRPLRIFLFFFLALLSPQFLETGKVEAQQQPPNDMVAPPPHAQQIYLKHVLVIGQTKGFEHNSISAAMAAIYTLGKESGLWDAMLRTDTELLTNEDPDFPAVRHFPKALTKYDEIYQPKDWSQSNVNVLLSLDSSKLNYANNPRIHRADHDFAWSKMYGKGRVFYSTLGHTEEAWEDPDIRKMYFEAVKWTLGMTEGSTMSHPKLALSAPSH